MFVNNLTELFVEITNECLQGCVHCSSCASSRQYDFIQIQDLRNLIDQGIELGLKNFTISGGEPFLYPELANLIQYINKKSLVFSIYTCGIVKDVKGTLVSISDEQMQAIAQSKPHKIIFSLHGTEEVHEKITGIAGSYQLTIQSIRKAKQLGLNVELHFVPMTINCSEIEGVVQVAQKLGISNLSLLRLVLQGRCLDDLMLPNEYGLIIKQTG